MHRAVTIGSLPQSEGEHHLQCETWLRVKTITAVASLLSDPGDLSSNVILDIYAIQESGQSDMPQGQNTT
jgi:hypothetical protein